MKVKVFTIRLCSDKFFSDQQLLNDFLETHKYVKSATHFVEGEDVNYWSVLLHYDDLTETIKKDRISYENLNPEQQRVFQTLKQWRAEKADKLRLANFMICHNSELLDIAVNRPSNINELRQIRGFGDKKSDKYGDDIIAVLNAI